LNGAAIEAENNTAMPTGFLMQQMEWREALDDAHALPAVEMLAEEVETHRRAAFATLQRTLDEDRDFSAAAQQVRALMFVERFAHDIDRRFEALGQ
jgi:molecular chaperone HscB